MRSKRNPVLPVEIKLPERVLLENGTLFVTLRTLDELEVFWGEHREQFEFACEGSGCESPVCLRDYEWVFGPSKSAVIQTVMRWAQTDVSCEFYDWSKNEPKEFECWFRDRDDYRVSQIEKSLWTDSDEKAYRADLIRRSPETYRGWWQLKNLPGGCDPLDWFRPFNDLEEIFNPNMAIEEVETRLQEKTFNDRYECLEDFTGHDSVSIDASISYWRTEKADGEEYYGCENENTPSEPDQSV